MTSIGLLLPLAIANNVVGYTLTAHSHQHSSYSVTSLVLLTELAKFVTAVLSHWAFDCRLSVGATVTSIRHASKSSWKFAVPAVCFAVMNNLAIFAGRHCPPHVIIVGNSLKMVSTAVMLRCILGRTISSRRLIAIVLITTGVTLAQLEQQGAQPVLPPDAQHTVGLLCIVVICILSGLASACMEVLFRSDQNNAEESSSSSIHIKNVQLYSFSCIATALCHATSSAQLTPSVEGFNWIHVLMVIRMTLDGNFLQSTITRYHGALTRQIANALSIIAISCLSILSGAPLSLTFALGAVIVIYASWLYHHVDASPSKQLKQG